MKLAVIHSADLNDKGVRKAVLKPIYIMGKENVNAIFHAAEHQSHQSTNKSNATAGDAAVGLSKCLILL
jgi:hypothetical protein